MNNRINELVNEDRLRIINGINLIASENIPTDAIMSPVKSVLTGKYAEGDIYKRYYRGCTHINQIEKIVIDNCKKAFRLNDDYHINVQPYSGAIANLAVYTSCLNPGDKILSLDLASGGHITHGAANTLAAKLYEFFFYGIDTEGNLLYDDIDILIRRLKPKLLIVGSSSLSRQIDFKKIYDITKKYDILVMADIAHYAGLVAAEEYNDPFPFSDFVTFTTHKTLRGPRGAVVVCRRSHAKDLDMAIFPGLQGGPFMNIIASKGICFEEAQTPDFVKYQKYVKRLSHTLCEGLKSRGWSIIGNGTNTHMFIVKVDNGYTISSHLEKYGIYVSPSLIPDDPMDSTVTSGIRIGTPWMSNFIYENKNIHKIENLLLDMLNSGLHGKDESLEKIKEITSEYDFKNHSWLKD